MTGADLKFDMPDEIVKVNESIRLHDEVMD